MKIDAMINRINELARKKRTVGLDEAELLEQKELYKQYLANIRGQLQSQLECIEFVDEKPKS